MYDALLADFEDDAPRTDDDSFPKIVDDDDAGIAIDEPASPLEAEMANSEEDEELLVEENESWSDDPVRMYLTQMGEIPLLTRLEEIRLAKKIEVTRRRFRAKLLECDYVIQSAFKVLKRVHQGELPFDRTVQVSVTDRLEKDQILGRLPHNLRTLEILLKRNRRDFRTALSKSQTKARRRKAWEQLSRRRRRSVRLVEELGLRTQRVEPMIRTLEEFSKRVEELKKRIVEHKAANGSAAERKPWLSEFRNILMATQETPTSLRRRVNFLRRVYS